MPSQRRMKAFGLLVAVTIVITLYMTSAAHQTRSSDFYTRTQEALQVREYEKAAKQRDAEDVGSRLKAAEAAAKEAADKKGDDFVNAIQGDERTVAGRVKMSAQDADEKKKMQGVAAVGGRPRDKLANKEAETQEEHEIEVELNAILKKSPIIIFSKTYCPHSKKAKHILLDKYSIDPKPFVVELDQHPLGEKLQATLAESTGRRTVPNVLVMGMSIGGGSEMQELDESDNLAETLKNMGGSRIASVQRSEERSEMRRRRLAMNA